MWKHANFAGIWMRNGYLTVRADTTEQKQISAHPLLYSPLALQLILMIITAFIQQTVLSLALAASLSSNALENSFPDSSSSWLVSQSSTSSSTSISAAAIIPQPFKRYETANDIPSSFYKRNKVIRGRVVKVIDGDTLRIRHTPLYPLIKGDNDCNGRRIPECTISIRLYGVDAPETAKRGNPSMPYSRDAMEYISNRVDGRMVRVKLLRKDQYSRAVGRVTTPNRYLPFLVTDLSKGLAERGYASLYTGGGAEYDGKREELEKVIQRAQKRRKGIWSNGVDDFVDPAEYKREMMKARRKK